MGERGPVPKRSKERMGHRAKDDDDNILALSSTDVPGFDELYEPPEPAEDWEPYVVELYEAALESLQRVWYQPSDWAALRLICEDLNREMVPRPVQVGVDSEGFPKFKMMRVPMPGAKLGAIMKTLSSLLYLEGDRRRLQIELTNQGQVDKVDNGPPATVTSIREGVWSA